MVLARLAPLRGRLCQQLLRVAPVAVLLTSSLGPMGPFPDLMPFLLERDEANEELPHPETSPVASCPPIRSRRSWRRSSRRQA